MSPIVRRRSISSAIVKKKITRQMERGKGVLKFSPYKKVIPFCEIYKFVISIFAKSIDGYVP